MIFRTLSVIEHALVVQLHIVRLFDRPDQLD